MNKGDKYLTGNRMKSIALHNLGCKVNAYEMEVMQQRFAESGYDICAL